MKLGTPITCAALLLFGGVAHADILSNCGSCQGSSYLLEYNPNNTAVSGGVTTYDVFLSIDPSAYTGGGLYINAVSIKVASMEASTGNSILSAPGGAANWTLHLGGLNAGACDGSGKGFICAQDGHTAPVPPNASYVAGATYTWEFHYATKKTLLTGNLASSIKAQYVDTSNNKVGALVSEGITLQSCTTDCGTFPGKPHQPIPEPASVILFGCLFSITSLVFLRTRRPA